MQISLENLFDNLKNKIGELKESTRSKDSIRFANLAQEICRLIAELGRQIGVQNFTFPKAIFQQFSIDFHLPEPAKKDVGQQGKAERHNNAAKSHLVDKQGRAAQDRKKSGHGDHRPTARLRYVIMPLSC